MSSVAAITEVDGRYHGDLVDLRDEVWGAGSSSARSRQAARSTRAATLSGTSPGYVFVKRCMDIAVSLFALVVLLPVFLIAALAVKLYDRGPVLFSQLRVGKNGRTFRCFKFRSMMINAQSLQQALAAKSDHSDPRTFKMANDPRITPVGRVLRRFSIDEFPQIFNVLLGDMSVVGPRPPLPNEVALYTDEDFKRLDVKPGLTCIWQVSGRSRLSFPEQVKMDVEYIQRQNILLDCAIILKTVPAVISGDGAA